MRVAVLGGGYAGLATLASLRGHLPQAELYLFDPRSDHILRTRLHGRIGCPTLRIRWSLLRICRRLSCRYVQRAVDISPEALKRWQSEGVIALETMRFYFDYLVVATGSRPVLPPTLAGALTPDDLADLDWGAYVQARLATVTGPCWISVIGGGPSGIQLALEIDAWCKQQRGQSFRLRLVTVDSVVLPAFPKAMREYVEKKLVRAGIEVALQTQVKSWRDGQLELVQGTTGKAFSLPSPVVVACLGLRPHPMALTTDAFGQVVLEGQPQERIFAAGDCAHFAGEGSNAVSAQVAIRKGRHVAENIWRGLRGWPMKPYDYQEQGYFLSLGPADGAGWLGHKDNVLTGLPAFFVKEMLETLYDLGTL